MRCMHSDQITNIHATQVTRKSSKPAFFEQIQSLCLAQAMARSQAQDARAWTRFESCCACRTTCLFAEAAQVSSTFRRVHACQIWTISHRCKFDQCIDDQLVANALAVHGLPRITLGSDHTWQPRVQNSKYVSMQRV